MATAVNGDWSRDHHADANPDLTRKRQRFSEEAEPSPQSSNGSVLIEALPVEDIDVVNNIDSAVKLQDDGIEMAPFSSTLQLDPTATDLAPLDQLNFLLQHVNGPHHKLRPLYFHNLSQWLDQHITQEPTTGFDLRERYLDDTDFFSLLGRLCHSIFQREGSLFGDAGEEYGVQILADSLERFVNATMEIAHRLVQYLPSVVDSAVARRDSAQTARTRQPIHMLHWVQVLAQVVALHRASQLRSYFRTKLGYKPKTRAESWRKDFNTRPATLAALTQLLHSLAQHHREVENAWEVIDAILRLVEVLDLAVSKEVESLLATNHMVLLPLVCEKHPRALPEGFHGMLVGVTDRLLNILLQPGDAEDLASLYRQYVKSEHDALVAEHKPDAAMVPLLQGTSEGSQETLKALIATAWGLQAYRAYIFSGIMDVRSNGLALLSTRLLKIFHDYDVERGGADHPMPQYAARFLRKNELTKYIFGPESHASLVKHCQNIIGFLAVTGSYTNLETDIIWTACTNSAETEFAAAAFRVLEDVSRYLDLDHLLHLAKKYTTTEPAKLGQTAVESLTALFQKVHVKSDSHSENCQRLATAFISIDIMMRVDATSQTTFSGQLRETAKMELVRFAQSTRFNAQDRMQIFSRCAPHIVAPSKHATTSIEIVVIFLREGTSDDEASVLLALLPVTAVVEELARYAAERRTAAVKPEQAYDVVATDARVDLIIRLLDFTKLKPSNELIHSIFEGTVGALAICNEARDRAWRMFSQTTPMAREMLLHWLKVEVIELSPNYTTPVLLELLMEKLQQWLQRDGTDGNLTSILDLLDWKKLVLVAESSCPMAVDAQELICQILFVTPENHVDKASAVACHTRFAERQIHSICNELGNVGRDPNGEQISAIVGKIGLLRAVLDRSKQHAAQYSLTQTPDLSLVDRAEDNKLCYKLEVHGAGHHHPSIVHVYANPVTKVSELTAKLPSITGAASHRMIVAGQEIALEERADDTLSNLGVQVSGVISICSKHTIKSDLETVLTMPGAIEQQVLEHYGELEVLLDAPGLVAAKISDLLVRIPTPMQVREKLSSDRYSAADLFPVEGTWRSMFYIDALHKHLNNLARLGVAEEAFLARGIALLVHVLATAPRPGQDDVCIRVMCVLTAFLREKPKTSTGGRLIEGASQFSTCIIRICDDALSRPPAQTRIQHALVNCAFELLQEVCRQQPRVWRSFTEDPSVVDLHAKILFEADRELSTHVATLIKNFCVDRDTPRPTINFYTQVVLGILPRALDYGDRAKDFFDLATKLLLNNSALWDEETRARDITRSLLSTLWSYEHIESEDVPVLDVALTGLLELLKESVQILRSYKKPLELQGLAAKLLAQFLFADCVGDFATGSNSASVIGTNDGSRQLFHPASRHAVYELIKAVCVIKDDFIELLRAFSIPLEAASDNPLDRYSGRKEYLRPATQCSGLSNLGQTCYMNSLLQQLYANVQFRQFILDTPTDRDQPKQRVLLQELKTLFACMQNSARPVADTDAIAAALGTEVAIQEDVHGFYEELLSKLELEMPDKATKAAFAKFYTGKLITQVKGECGHVSPRTESFVDLPIVVKNKRNLAETLDELVQGEPMRGANQYRCQACDPNGGGRLVDAMRRGCPDVIPDNLTFCLKRFEYDPIVGLETKISDRFEFPQKINMSKYHHAYLDNPEEDIPEDIFELVGVIVHMGTMDYGHYWSYVLLRNTDSPQSRTWVKLEDRNVTTCQDGLAQVQHECFGGLRFNNGNERTDNAYVLFYQRKHILEAQIALPGITVDPQSQAVLPPRVAFDNTLEDEIRRSNACFHRAAHLFDEDLSALLRWIMEQCKLSNFIVRAHVSSSPGSSSDTSSDNDKTGDEVVDVKRSEAYETDEEVPVDELIGLLSRVGTAFIQRIAPCDPAPVKKLNLGINGLSALIQDQPKLASCVLRDFSRTTWFWSIIRHNKKAVRTTVQAFLWHCSAVVREHDPRIHHEAISQLRSLHASYLRVPDSVAALDWIDYLGFAAQMAALSPNDTAAVLDAGYWSWAFEMLRLPFDKAIRGKYPGLLDDLDLLPSKMAALYEFILHLLENHLAIPDLITVSPEGGPHAVKDGKALLTRSELEMLAAKCPGSSVFTWIRSSRYADTNTIAGWKDFMPGKLLGFLVNQGPSAQLSQVLQTNLLQHIDAEEESFSSVLSLVMNFCTSIEAEEDACEVFAAVVKIAPAWEGSEGELTQILPSAFEAIPRVVLTTLELWTKHFLLIKASMLRKSAAAFIIEHVFDEDVNLAEPDMVAVRARLAAKLVREGTAELRHGYNEEKSRNRYESMIEVFKYLQPYLQSFRQSVSEQLRDGDAARIPLDLMAEYDRAQQTLSALEELGPMVDEWESEHAQSALLTGVVRSREEESEEYDTDDGNGEWDSSSDLA